MPVQINENWSTVIRGFTPLGINKKLLNFTAEDCTDRDRFTSKILPALLAVIGVGYARKPTLKPKISEVPKEEESIVTPGAAAAVGAHVAVAAGHTPEDKSEF